MEQNDSESRNYMNDLEELIHLKIHESFEAKAELDVLKDLMQTTKEKCDTIAEKIKTVKNSCCPEDKEEHRRLSQDIYEKWSWYKYYQDKKAVIEEKIVNICNELSELLFQKMHVEVVH